MKQVLCTGSMLLAAGALAGCAGEPATEAPTDIGIAGGFRATLDQGARLVIASEDGRVLIGGLPPGGVPPGGVPPGGVPGTVPGDGAEDAPPLVGFAVRDVAMTYEMLVGAFKPTQSPAGPWRVATKVSRHDEEGAVVLDLTDDAGKNLARARLSTPETGHLVLDVTPGEGPERRFSMGFACDPSDHFAGFGPQTADVDHRGFTVPTLVEEQGVGKDSHDDYTGAWFLKGRRHSSYAPIPQYLSSRGYIFTAETNRKAWFALCSESERAARVEVELPVKLHLFDGPSPGEAVERATAHFGRPRLPPRVAFAPWNDAIFGSENVRAIAKQLRDEKVPSSVIWTEDWKGADWNGESYSLAEEWDVDSKLYPDFPKLAGDLHDLGFHFYVYFDPFVYTESAAWPDTSSKGLLVKRQDGSPYVFTGGKLGDTGLIDLDNPEGRAWAVKEMREAMALGVDGWMNDFGEWLPTDAVTFAGSGMDRHNLYPVLWQETAREAIDGAPDGKERLFFARSGWFGTPALADVMWAGDQRTDMQEDDGLPTILPIGIGLGVVGISTFGHDVAGYMTLSNDGSTRETFFRWTSLGAWSPVMRTHHGWQPLKNWTWNKDAETVAHFRRYAALHMSLVPMWEGLAKRASDTGLPIWRGLFMAYPEDAAVWPIRDEVMVGDGLLVAPVQTPGQTSRPVYLPEGRWYPWSGGAAEEGGRTIEVESAVTEIPVFAREGTVIPTFPDGVMTLVNGSAEVPDASSVGDDRVVYVFLGKSGGFTEVSGLSYALEQGEAVEGTLSYALSRTSLPPCGEPVNAPCFDSFADPHQVHLVGPTELTLTGASGGSATVKIKGGAADRKLTLVVRR